MYFIKHIALFLVLCILALGVSDSSAEIVVVPNDLANAEGPADNEFPYACELENGIRYQQIFTSSQFDGSIQINSLRYRMGEDEDGFPSTTVQNVIISLSTTTATPAAFSTTFANNTGPDVTLVYDAPLTISGTACDVGPCPFDTIIPLQTPFTYNPANGNLLVDVTVPVCGNFDDNFFDADSGNVVTRRIFNNDASDPNGFSSASGALVTQFIGSIVPITLSPPDAMNGLFTDHTVTAEVEDNFAPVPGALVQFEILAGPNQGLSSVLGDGVCDPLDCRTGSNGEVTWTYSSSELGTDTIVARTDAVGDSLVTSNSVINTWILVRNIPTLSEWGLIAMAGVLGIIAAFAIRRRKASV